MMNKTPIHISQCQNSSERYIHFYNIDPDLEFTIVQAGYQIPYPVEHIRPIIRDHYLLHFISAGSGSLLLPQATYNAGQNDCFLIYPQEISTYMTRGNENWEYYWIGFGGTKAEKYLSLAGFEPGKQVMHFENPEVFTTLKQIIAASFKYQNDLAALELHVGSLLRSLFFILYTETRNKRSRYVLPVKQDNTSMLGSGQYNDKYVSTIVMMIQSSYSQDIRVEDIADNLHLNRSYLSTLFKKETGKSIKQYLTHYRILSAMKFLRETDNTITSISFQVGFSDPLYFSKLFKAQVGQSPSEYRQSSKH